MSNATLSSISRLAVAMHGIIHAASMSAPDRFEIKPRNYHKKRAKSSLWSSASSLLSSKEQVEKIEACKIKQDRKAVNRLHCYESSLFWNPIKNADTLRRLEEIHTVTL